MFGGWSTRIRKGECGKGNAERGMRKGESGRGKRKGESGKAKVERRKQKGESGRGKRKAEGLVRMSHVTVDAFGLFS
ncbi:MAG: hypothetical protein EYC68_22580 [Chloroflexota bacterium]|nr:MAG: hypothetical protein EYC68_22580 [Chloroflexota bacterium]